jgi:transitional endoplasmic reticulum ATPase
MIDHFKRGMAARAAGKWAAARQEFVMAQREAQGLIALAQGADLRGERTRFAGRLADLIADTDKALAENRPAPEAPAGSSADRAAPDPVAAASSSAPARTPIKKGSRDNAIRSESRAIDAYKAGQWSTAATYFTLAADEFEALSREPGIVEDIRVQRAERARRLREKAEDSTRADEQRRKPISAKGRGSGGGGGSGESASSADGENSAQQWIVKEKSSIRFADVAGLEKVKEDIRLKMIYPFEHADLAEKFGIKPGGGVLMYGPPGTGKTMLAKATAGEIEATFFRISPADVLSKWVGEAEQNIKKLFDAAANEKRSIIFIDEIEALVPARKDDGSSVMQRVVPQILQGVEGFDKKAGRSVLLMGATNVPWQLDPAMLRPGRFDEKIYIPLPDFPARRKLLEIYLSKRPLAEDIDLDALAEKLEGYSGADVKHFCERAATIPFLRSVATGAEGLIDAEVLAQAYNECQRSVTREMLARFEEWAKAAETTGGG